MTASSEHQEGIPSWFWELTPLTMDPLKGPDSQYSAGVKDALTVVTRILDSAYHPQLGENPTHPLDVLDLREDRC